MTRAEGPRRHPRLSLAAGAEREAICPRRVSAPGHPTPPERLLVWLFRRFPPKETIFRDSAPRPLAEYEDEVRFAFPRYFGRDTSLFAGKDILDLGSGFGGRPVCFLECGARSVTGVETSDELVEHARRFAEARNAVGATFVKGFGEDLPVSDESFDLITMNDVLEHVIDPGEVLGECWRVLRPGGRVAAVFPPYYDVTAGSHLHGYATRLPGLNLLFPSRTLKRAARRHLEDRGIEYKRYLREVLSDKLWNVNGLTAHGFRRIVKSSPFAAEQIWYLGHLDHRLAAENGWPRLWKRAIFALAELPAQIPGIQEVACVRVCAVIRKPKAVG